MEPPPGQPKDEQGPVVVAVHPAPEATEVDRELLAIVEFSEWIQPTAAGSRVQLNPPLPTYLKVKTQGRQLRISSPFSLQDSLTYKLTLSPGLADILGNPMAEVFNLVFSTGPSLDSGSISGELESWPTKPEQALLGLYPRPPMRMNMDYLVRGPKGRIEPDSFPNPAKERPMYSLTVDSTGAFSYPHMRPGTYGIVAFEDANGNQLLNPPAERAAIGPPEFELHSDGTYLHLYLGAFDTSYLRIEQGIWSGYRTDSAGGRVRGSLELDFSRKLDSAQALSITNFLLISADSTDTLGILDAAMDPLSRNVHLHLPSLSIDSTYVIRYRGPPGAYSLDSARIWTSFRADTSIQAKPLNPVFVGQTDFDGLRARIPDSAQAKREYYHGFANRPMTDSMQLLLERQLRLELDSLTVPYRIEYLDSRNFHIVIASWPKPAGRLMAKWLPDTTATSEGAMSDTLATDSLPAADSALGVSDTSDLSRGNRSMKPAPVILFSHPILADSVLASILILKDNSTTGWYLMASHLVTGQTYMFKNSAAVETKWSGIPPGKYRLEYFEDRNRNGFWDAGSLSPWIAQEKRSLWQDSLQLAPGETWSPNRPLSWPPARIVPVDPAGTSE